MKKKIISLLLVSVCGCSCLIGCGEDVINRNENNNDGVNRFIDTGDRYTISGWTYELYYDNVTNIVYLSTGGRAGITVLYNSDGKPMKLNEYNETK